MSTLTDEQRELRDEERRYEYLLDQEEEDRAALAALDDEYGDGNPEGDPTRNGAW